MSQHLRLSAQFTPWRKLVEFYLVDELPVSDYPHLQPHLLQPDGDVMKWERQQEGLMYARPSFELTESKAQELLDMLWMGGFRPRSAINEASRIEAVTRHLEDMRAIAFDRLKVGAPAQR